MRALKDFLRLMLFWLVFMPITIVVMLVTGISDLNVEEQEKVDDHRTTEE